MLKYLKSDFGIVVLCLVFYFCTFFNDDQEVNKYAIGIALHFFPCMFYSLDNICN
jgi:hypothetical protein